MNLSVNSTNLQNFSKEKRAIVNRLLEEYKYRWSIHARDKQTLPAGSWQTWLIKAGRGFGKTRTGAETIRIWKDHYPILHLVGATAGDVRDIMIEGKGGLLESSPNWDKPRYEPSKRRITWENGSRGLLFSADEPERLRGPQCYKAWADELASWRYPEAWDQLQFGLRLGNNPQCIVTTTPRPTKVIRELIKDEHTHVTSGSSYENRANLAKSFFDNIIKKYEGTRLGRQELMAELLEDVEGALWTLKLIDQNRVNEPPELKKIVVAIDPAVTNNPDSDETGIVVCGLGINNHAYILADVSGKFSPRGWAERAVYNYEKWEADEIIAEANNGGDLVEVNIRTVDDNVPIRLVHASRGKVTRAEPVVTLDEQGRIHHVGTLAELEDQMTTWDAQAGDKSPDRVDARVWGVWKLMLEKEKGGGFA